MARVERQASLVKVARAAGLVLLGIAVLAAGAWSTAALWFLVQEPALARAALTAASVTEALGTAGCLATRLRWRALAAHAIAIACVVAWWTTILPSNDKDWAAEVARTATGRIIGDHLAMENVRNFEWLSDTSANERWERRDYDLSRIVSTDLIVSYWAGEAIAHVIVSFGFEEAKWLAFSVEIRKEQGEAFSALAGFFKRYELAIVAADERDIVRVRSNVRGEDVRIYRVRMSHQEARNLVRGYVEAMNDLSIHPQFYNTLTANCTTVVFGLVRAVQPGLVMDPRVLLSGYFPNYLRELGATASTASMADLREAAKIRQRSAAADAAADYSLQIREGVPLLH